MDIRPLNLDTLDVDTFAPAPEPDFDSQAFALGEATVATCDGCPSTSCC